MEPILSFATRAEADAYNAAHLFGTDWAPLDNDVKDRALYTATQLLNNNLVLAVVTDGTAPVPQSLKNATAEYARILATDPGSDPAQAGGTENLKGISVGPVKIDFKVEGSSSAKIEKRAPYLVIPPHILAMIDHLIISIVGPKPSMMPLKNV